MRPRTSLLEAVLVGGFVAGALDIVYAFGIQMLQERQDGDRAMLGPNARRRRIIGT